MTKKYRIKLNGYYSIYKPHYVFSHPVSGYAKEHRYIIHIYLSILNGKPTYLYKDDDVHHINGDKLDNRISNLQLIRHGDHSKITYKNNNGLVKYKSILEEIKLSKICNICETNRTKQWHNDINGVICSICYMIIWHCREKFGLPTSGY